MEKGEREQELRQQVEDALSKMRPNFGGADLKLKEINQVMVTLKYYRPLSNPSACHVDRTPISKEIVQEVLEEQLKKLIPDCKKVILLEES